MLQMNPCPVLEVGVFMFLVRWVRIANEFFSEDLLVIFESKIIFKKSGAHGLPAIIHLSSLTKRCFMFSNLHVSQLLFF